MTFPPLTAYGQLVRAPVVYPHVARKMYVLEICNMRGKSDRSMLVVISNESSDISTVCLSSDIERAKKRPTPFFFPWGIGSCR